MGPEGTDGTVCTDGTDGTTEPDCDAKNAGTRGGNGAERGDCAETDKEETGRGPVLALAAGRDRSCVLADLTSFPSRETSCSWQRYGGKPVQPVRLVSERGRQ